MVYNSIQKSREGIGRQQNRQVDLTQKKALIVDAQKTSREILRLQLEARGCKVEESQNGVEALQKLQEAAFGGKPFNIAILDNRIPAVNGVPLGKQIKDDSTLNQTFLILLTSVGKYGDAASIKKIGFSAYLTKPVKQSQLYKNLAVIFGQNDEKKNLPAPQGNTPEETRRPARVLVANDNLVNQKVAKKMLQKLGHTVKVVNDGIKAIEAVEKNKYDLILMDCQMPELDGFEATRVIRSNESSDETRIAIVTMTANAMQGDREKCLKAGMDDYLTKPVKQEDLTEMVNRWTK